VASDQPKRKWALPTSLTTAGMLLLSGGGEISNAAQPGQKTSPTPKVAEDDTVKQKVQALINEMKTHLNYIGEVKRKAEAGEIEKHIKAMGSEAYSERENANRALLDIGYPAKLELKKALKNPDPEIARRAARILEVFKPIDDMRAKKLTDPVFRLREIGPAAKDAVPVLREAFKENNSDLRWRVVTALLFIGPGAKAAVPELIEALEDEDINLRNQAVDALRCIGPEAKAAVPQLIKILKDSDNGFSIKYATIRALGKIGAEPEKAVPELIKAFDDNEAHIGRIVAEALGGFTGKMGPDETKAALAMLITGLKRKEDYVVSQVIDTLGKMGPEAKAAIPALEALRDSKPDARWGEFLTNQIRREAGAAVEAIAKTRGR